MVRCSAGMVRFAVDFGLQAIVVRKKAVCGVHFGGGALRYGRLVRVERWPKGWEWRYGRAMIGLIECWFCRQQVNFILASPATNTYHSARGFNFTALHFFCCQHPPQPAIFRRLAAAVTITMNRKSSNPARISVAKRASATPRRKRLRPGSAPPNSAFRSQEQFTAALRLSLLSGVGAFLAVESLLKRLNVRAAKKICAARQARIADAKKQFVARVTEIAAADAWDETAYEAAVSEFSAARAEESGTWDSSRAIAAHRRARMRREEAWTLWIDEFVGEIRQLLGYYTVVSDFKTPAAKILGKGLDLLGDTLEVRRRIRDGSIGKRELENLIQPPSAPGERRRTRKGAPIRRLCARSLLPPPEPAELLAGWEATRGHGKVAEKIRLGSLLLDAEASVDSSLIRDRDGEIVGRKPGLKGWLETNCPQLMPHYGSLMRFRRLAAAFREEHGLCDPVPAAALLEGREKETPLCKRLTKLPEFRREQIDAARKKAAELLAGAEGKTASTLERQLAERKERREEVYEAVREGVRMARKRRRETGGIVTA